MNHSFNTVLAKKYGILEAVLLENIAHWLDKNQSNGMNFKEGRYWTYNSAKGFAEQFDYVSAHQIRRALDHLVEKNVLMRNCFNKAGFDKTSWYTLTDSFLASEESPFGKIAKGRGIYANGCGNSANPIPDINTNINTEDISNQKTTCPHQTMIDLFAEKVPDLPKPRIWTGKREKDMLARWKWVVANKVKDKDNAQAEAIEFFARFFEYVNDSDFLTGRSGAWDKCDLPWLMKEENFAKVIEGNYENKGN